MAIEFSWLVAIPMGLALLGVGFGYFYCEIEESGKAEYKEKPATVRLPTQFYQVVLSDVGSNGTITVFRA